MKPVNLCLLLFLLGNVLPTQGQNAEALQPVIIPGTESFTIKSEAVGQDYQVEVFLPENYQQSEEAYPVLYLLDGDYAFAMATDIATYLKYGKHIPELIIVSPTYNDKTGPEDGGGNYRRRDYSPFKWGFKPKHPGADKFYLFMKEELIPEIEARYRTQPDDRTIWGYSRSGLFILWALFEKPGLFQRYIAIDTAFRLFDELEQDYAEAHDALNAHLYIGHGELGSRKKDLKVIQRIAERGYKGLAYQYEALQGESHFVIPAIGLALGLKAVFD